MANDITNLKRIPETSKKPAIFLFIFIFGIAGFSAVWILFLNKGTLVVQGAAPFTLKAGDETIECVDAPCRLTLRPREYRIIAQKAGFFDAQKNIAVERGKETSVSLEFQFIPALTEIENPKLEKTAGKVSPFSLKKIDGDSGEELIFKNQDEKSEQVIAKFRRPFKKPALYSNVSNSKVVIQDEIDGKFSYYLVDVEKKSRRAISLSEKTSKARWVGDYLIAEEEDAIVAISSANLGKTPLPASDIEDIVEWKSGILVFLSFTNLDTDRPKLGQSITETLDPSKKASSKIIYLTQWIAAEDIMRTLVEIPIEGTETVQNLTADDNSSNLFFEKSGKWFEVLMTPEAW